MKKIIVLSLFVSLFITSKAQTTFGFKGGVNLASVKVVVPEAGMSVSTSNNTSFFLGGYMNHLLSENYHSTFGNGTSTKSSALSIGLSYSL